MRTADTPELRKARGAFFTPSEICRHLVEWAIRSPDDLIFEPSCGEAAFLLAAGNRLAALGARPAAEVHLFGVDLHSDSVERARALATEAGLRTQLAAGDFFAYSTTLRFDGIVGNPPYVRYQGFSGDARAKARAAALEQGVRLTALASSWAAFVVHATRFLKPDGRLGLVLPAELLTVNYAAAVRSFLLERFARVRLVLFKERVFPGVIEEVLLLLAEGTGPTDHVEVYQVHSVRNLRSDARAPVIWTPATAHDKWIGALLPDGAAAVYARVARDRERFVELIEWGDPTLGMVTGNNRYFTLTEEHLTKLGVDESELLRISPPGSRHLRGISFGPADWRRMRAEGRAVYLFLPDPERPSEAARRYIAAGRRQKVHTAYKCRMRDPWWRVPLVAKPDLFFTYMNADAPRLVSNTADTHYLNSIHGIVLPDDCRRVGMDLLPLGFLNSLSLAGAELVGRSYGGGILKLEPKEADRLPVPSPALLRAAARSLRPLRAKAAALLAEGRLDDVVRAVDDALLLEHAGLRFDDVHQLQAARAALHARRAARMGS